MKAIHVLCCRFYCAFKCNCFWSIRAVCSPIFNYPASLRMVAKLQFNRISILHFTIQKVKQALRDSF
uniref:Uncharacterized protein n=1 Tax=Anguilla anguilla TaxID=7936 RepID=A0A0E9TQL5_ANGAN